MPRKGQNSPQSTPAARKKPARDTAFPCVLELASSHIPPLLGEYVHRYYESVTTMYKVLQASSGAGRAPGPRSGVRRRVLRRGVNPGKVLHLWPVSRASAANQGIPDTHLYERRAARRYRHCVCALIGPSSRLPKRLMVNQRGKAGTTIHDSFPRFRSSQKRIARPPHSNTTALKYSLSPMASGTPTTQATTTTYSGAPPTA